MTQASVVADSRMRKRRCMLPPGEWADGSRGPAAGMITRKALVVLAFSLCLGPAALAGPLPRSLTLAPGWLFQQDPLDVGTTLGWQKPAFDRSGWRKVAVPSAWDEYDATMDGYEGACWYAFQLPASEVAPGSWQRLRFGRVNHRATVWVDGEKVAEDSLGYLPFEAVVTPRLKPGKPAWIVVRAE